MPAGAPLRPELRILSLSPCTTGPHSHGQDPRRGLGAPPASCCFEKASDALTVAGYSEFLPKDYLLVPSYGCDSALLGSGEARKRTKQQTSGGGGSSSGGTKSRRQSEISGHQQQQRVSTAGAAAAADSASGTAAEDAQAEAAAADGSGDVHGDAAAGAAAEPGGDLVVEDFGEFMYFIVSPQVNFSVKLGSHGLQTTGNCHSAALEACRDVVLALIACIHVAMDRVWSVV